MSIMTIINVRGLEKISQMTRVLDILQIKPSNI